MFKTGVPTLHQFFHARDINAAIVQPTFDVGHVLGEEATVSANGIATQGNLVGFGAVLAYELEGLGHGFVE